jgi:hypothetical protein
MDRDPVTPKVSAALDPEDYYYEGEYMVFTAAYHLKRGTCCGSDCRHCPYGNAPGDKGDAPMPPARKP